MFSQSKQQAEHKSRRLIENKPLSPLDPGNVSEYTEEEPKEPKEQREQKEVTAKLSQTVGLIWLLPTGVYANSEN